MKLAILAAVAGCSAGNVCQLYEWHVEYSRTSGASHEGAEGKLVTHPDGTLALLVNDPFAGEELVQVGDRFVQGTQLARIDPAGTLLSVAALKSPQFARNAGIAFVGEETVAIWSTIHEVTITTYSRTLSPRWSLTKPTENNSGGVNAIAADGSVAFLTSDTLVMTSLLYVLDPDGRERWTAEDAPLRMTFAANGDLFELLLTADTVTRRRRAAADGALLEELRLDLPVDHEMVLLDDGGVLASNVDEDGHTSVTRLAPDGSVQWSRLLDRNYGAGINGNVILQGHDLLVLDPETGETLVTETTCDYFKITATDASGYYGIGAPGVPSVGVARYAFTERDPVR